MVKNKFRIDVPVLLVGFNRPDVIQKSIDNLRQYSLMNLYVALDGPRVGNADDDIKVSQVRQIVKNIDFCPNIHYWISEENHGAEVTISSAISWVLENEEYVVVMEDDIIAHQSFFQFMQDMLERYKDDDRVAMVSGCNYTPMKFPNDEDYCFCQCGHTSGGWATWKRVWKDYDLYEEIKDECLTEDFLLSISANKKIAKQRKKQFRKLKENWKNNNWDVMFGYFRNTRKLLSIVPRAHLTSNIGIYGLHQNGVTGANFKKIDDNFVAIHHPKDVTWNKKYDSHHYHEWIERTLWKRVFGRIKMLFLK